MANAAQGRDGYTPCSSEVLVESVLPDPTEYPPGHWSEAAQNALTEEADEDA